MTPKASADLSVGASLQPLPPTPPGAAGLLPPPVPRITYSPRKRLTEAQVHQVRTGEAAVGGPATPTIFLSLAAQSRLPSETTPLVGASPSPLHADPLRLVKWFQVQYIHCDASLGNDRMTHPFREDVTLAEVKAETNRKWNIDWNVYMLMIEGEQPNSWRPVVEVDTTPLSSLRAMGTRVQLMITKKPEAVAVPESPDPRQSTPLAHGRARVDKFTRTFPPAALPTTLQELQPPKMVRRTEPPGTYLYTHIAEMQPTHRRAMKRLPSASPGGPQAPEASEFPQLAPPIPPLPTMPSFRSKRQASSTPERHDRAPEQTAGDPPLDWHSILSNSPEWRSYGRPWVPGSVFPYTVDSSIYERNTAMDTHTPRTRATKGPPTARRCEDCKAYRFTASPFAGDVCLQCCHSWYIGCKWHYLVAKSWGRRAMQSWEYGVALKYLHKHPPTDSPAQ